MCRLAVISGRGRGVPGAGQPQAQPAIAAAGNASRQAVAGRTTRPTDTINRRPRCRSPRRSTAGQSPGRLATRPLGLSYRPGSPSEDDFVTTQQDTAPYPIGTPGTPWGADEKAAWLARQHIRRSYDAEVVQPLKAAVPAAAHLFSYGVLDYARL